MSSPVHGGGGGEADGGGRTGRGGTRIHHLLGPDLAGLLTGLAAYASADMAARAVRMVAVVVIARRIDAAMLGEAALALTCFELVRVLASVGIGQRIIASDEAELGAICNTARALFGRWCAGVAGVQLAVAAVLWLAFAKPEVAMMVALLSGVYLMMPAGLVQVYLLQRAGRLGVTARTQAAQTMTDHALTMLLALVWPSAWAIVLPKLMTVPIWVGLNRRALHWRADPAHGHAPVAGFVRFGWGVLGTELVGAARLQADKLIIGVLLGVQALGTWYFAFNAGLGITTAFVTAFSTALFPYLCKAAGPGGARAPLPARAGRGLRAAVAGHLRAGRCSRPGTCRSSSARAGHRPHRWWACSVWRPRRCCSPRARPPGCARRGARGSMRC